MSALLIAIVTVAAPTSVLAANAQIELALRPVDQPGSYFDLTMRPGETRGFALEISNNGDDALVARTYAADVYTIINGGFGGRLRDEPRTGATLWLEYATRVLDLPPGKSLQRALTVAVPLDAGPGEYISSIVLENDQPIRGGGELGIDQIVRQAIAVVITIPGERSPSLAIGDATHKDVDGRSTVAVAVKNAGNVRLRPVGEFTLFDTTGSEVSRATIPMDTFYAYSATLLEVPLAARLLPGRYTVRLTLDDTAQGVTTSEPAIVLIVEAPGVDAADNGLVPGLTEVIQRAGDDLALVPWAVIILAGLVIGAGIGRAIIDRRRGRA